MATVISSISTPEPGSVFVKVYKDWNDAVVSKVVVATNPSPKDHALKTSGGVGPARSVKLRIENVDGGALHIDTITFSFIPRRFR